MFYLVTQVFIRYSICFKRRFNILNNLIRIIFLLNIKEGNEDYNSERDGVLNHKQTLLSLLKRVCLLNISKLSHLCFF